MDTMTNKKRVRTTHSQKAIIEKLKAPGMALKFVYPRINSSDKDMCYLQAIGGEFIQTVDVRTARTLLRRKIVVTTHGGFLHGSRVDYLTLAPNYEESLQRN